MEYELFDDIGKRKREQRGGINEDSIGAQVIEQRHRGERRSIGLFVVADGAGGHDCGDVASYLATTTILEKLSTLLLESLQAKPSQFGVEADEVQDTDPPGERAITAAIEEAINAAHTEVLRYARDAEVKAHTTATVCVRSGRRCYYGWVGDSPLYLVNRSDATIEPAFTPHSEVERKIEQRKLDEVEALVHPDSNKITRALGGSQYKNPDDAVDVDTGSVQLYAEDTVLLTSDGLVDAANTTSRMKRLHTEYQQTDDREEIARRIREEVVTEADIKDIVLDSGGLSATADQLVRFANEHGGKDNIAGVLFTDPSLPGTPANRRPRGVEAGSIVDRTTRIHR